MNYELQSHLSYELKLLKNDYKRYNERLSMFDGAQNAMLKEITPYGKYKYYCVKQHGDKKFRYLSVKDKETVPRIREAVHLAKTIDCINSNIALIESILDEYQEYDFGSINRLLPEVYQSADFADNTEYQQIAGLWKKDQLAYAATFPKNYPEWNQYPTSDGTKVKTLSEVIAYDRFVNAGLVPVYERPLPANDYGPNLYPDFTILSPVDMKTEIIVEYVGMLDLQKYREDFAKRIYRYMQNGYIPGVNLFFIFGDEKGRIDTLQINKIIADIYGLR